MKIKLAILVVVVLHAWSFAGFAQDTSSPTAGDNTLQPNATPPAPVLAQSPAGAAVQPAEAAGQKPADITEKPPGAVLTTAADAASGSGASQEAGTINIPEAPLTDVVSTLARQANINFQFDPKVTGGVGADGKPMPQPIVSIRWENVTALQALEALLNNHNLVLVQDQKTKIARITPRDPAAPEPLVTRVIQLKYAATTNMVTIIQPTLSPRGKVLGDARSSQLVVLATEKEMEGVDALLAQLDVAPKQVLIEAHLMETSRNPKTVKGIDWSGTLAAQNISFGNGKTTGTTDTIIPGVPSSSTTTLPSGRTITTASTAPSSTITRLTTLLGDGGIGLNTAKGFHPATAFLNADGLHAVLSFLNSDSDTEVVATPRAVTLDNQTARLEVTRAFPIFKITPGSSQTPAGSEITYTNLGTILTVTPRISANSNIALKVVPEVSNIDSVDKQLSNGQAQTANVYAIRRIETQVVIPSGHTLVMGGLISDSSSKIRTKIPILGDLPVVGLAFRHDNKSRLKSNLLIFITPTIVNDEDFQPAPSQFLKTKAVEKVDKEESALESAWNSGKPYDWTKPVE